MRATSRITTAILTLAGLVAVAAAIAVPASAGSSKPKITYAEFGENSNDESEYQFEVRALRANSVAVELRRSPKEGRTTGPRETIRLSKGAGKVWRGTTSKTRSSPCYEATFVAKNSAGQDSRRYRLCIFGFDEGGGDERITLTRW